MSELSQKEIDSVLKGLDCLEYLKYIKDISEELYYIRKCLQDISQNVCAVEVSDSDS